MLQFGGSRVSLAMKKMSFNLRQMQIRTEGTSLVDGIMLSL